MVGFEWDDTGVFELMIGPSHYPPKIYDGTFLKVIFLTIAPMYYAFFYPYELIQNFSFLKLFYVLAGAVFFMGIGIFTFNKGLKKYESGNLFNTNI